MRISVLFVSALSLLVPACAEASDMAAGCPAVTVQPDPGLQAAIDEIVESVVEEGFAGQVALMQGDRLIYQRAAGFADLDSEVPVTDTTLFQVSSIAKYFTAVLTLKAVDLGLIELDDPIGRYLPEAGPVLADLTFDVLLSHRSGLQSSYAAESRSEPLAALAAIEAAGVDPARAGRFSYSNDGFDLLAIALERIYGQPFESAMRAQVLEPACLEHVAFWGEIDVTDPHRVGQPLQAVSEAILPRNYGSLGSFGLLITATELVRFQHALRTGRVLSDAMLEELVTPRINVSASFGDAAYGGFLVPRPDLGQIHVATGTEDWGDNAYLRDVVACGFTFSVVTSRGPLADGGSPLFRNVITLAVEPELVARCTP